MVTWTDVLKKATEHGFTLGKVENLVYVPVNRTGYPDDYVETELMFIRESDEKIFTLTIRELIFMPSFLLAWAKFEKSRMNGAADWIADEGFTSKIGSELIALSLDGKPYLDYFSQFLDE